jgi:hypothetical protein
VSQSVFVPVVCPQCSSELVVHFDDWEPGAPAKPAEWTCPECQEAFTLGIIGKATAVTREEPKDA